MPRRIPKLSTAQLEIWSALARLTKDEAARVLAQGTAPTPVPENVREVFSLQEVGQSLGRKEGRIAFLLGRLVEAGFVTEVKGIADKHRGYKIARLVPANAPDELRPAVEPSPEFPPDIAVAQPRDRTYEPLGGFLWQNVRAGAADFLCIRSLGPCAARG